MDSRCTVVFFDEIDALGQSRGSEESQDGSGCTRRILAELLIQLTSLSQDKSSIDQDDYDSDCDSDSENAFPVANQNQSATENGRVVIVAATNRPEDCDPALLRRFSIRVRVGEPSTRDRKKIFSKFLPDFEHTVTKSQLGELAASTEGWSGSDIESMIREAAMAPVRECLRATALSRRALRKQEQRGGDVSGQELRTTPRINPEQQFREQLLQGFRTLRPVTLNDFENAIAFVVGKNGNRGNLQKQVDHYDSSDSEED